MFGISIIISGGITAGIGSVGGRNPAVRIAPAAALRRIITIGAVNNKIGTCTFLTRIFSLLSLLSATKEK